MTTPEPLTYREIEKMEPNLLMMCGPRRSDAIDRLLYTARLGAKLIELTHLRKEKDNHDTEP